MNHTMNQLSVLSGPDKNLALGAASLATEAWEEPIPFATCAREQFPLATFPLEMRKYAEAVVEYLQVPTDFVAFMMLAALATVVQRVIYVTDGIRTTPLNFWGLCTGESGSGKTSADQEIIRPIVALEAKLKKSIERANRASEWERKSLEGMLVGLQGKKDQTSEDKERVKGVLARLEDIEEIPLVDLFVTDPSTESGEETCKRSGNRLSIINGEAGDFISIMMGLYSPKGSPPNLKLWLAGYSQETCKVGRILRGDKTIERPTISMCLAVQPLVLTRFSENREAADRGLLGRFLFSQPGDMAGDRVPPRRRRRLTDGDRTAWSSLVESLAEMTGLFELRKAKRERTLDLHFAAIQAYDDFWNEVEAGLKLGGKFYEIKVFAKRLPEKLIRIAGLLHLMEGHGEPWEVPISAQTMNHALTIIRWSLPHALDAHGVTSRGAVYPEAESLWQFLVEQGELSCRFRVIMQKGPSFCRKSTNLDALLKVLEDHNWLQVVEERSSKGGTPRKLIHLNPKALSPAPAPGGAPRSQTLPARVALQNTKAQPPSLARAVTAGLGDR